ncbi:MAG: serine/threonine protein kinase [Deltaproteobacteria bacterium]|nr:serine/threonine protein kinase [Deltaproteobacteria bacterium]
METIGNYRVIQKLAHGGMAEIFLGVHNDSPDDSNIVVIKQILPHLAHDPRFLAMFLNEAQLASQMHHPGIVQVMEFGEDNGLLFMVMEFVDGLDCWRFAKLSEMSGNTRVTVAVYIVEKILDALSYAHNLRDINGNPMYVVHRDLSPSNIYLSQKGNVKLGDFGIAKVESNYFRPIKVIPKGKFGYMAPEQVEGKDADARADVYSAGVVLTELIIREQLFAGASQLSIMRDIRDGRIERLEQNVEKIPPGLREILKGALARNPEERYRSAAEFKEALLAFDMSLSNTLSRKDFSSMVVKVIEDYKDEHLHDHDSNINAIAMTLAGQEIVGVQLTKPDGITAVTAVRSSMNGKTPITMDFDQITGEGQYWAKVGEGGVMGPMPFAHIIELIYRDKIKNFSEVSKDGHVYTQARHFDELARHLPVSTPTSKNINSGSPKRRGMLEIETVLNVLLTIATSKDYGVLVCEHLGKRKEIYVKDGLVLYVSSNESGDLLGEYLVNNDIIEQVELEMALALLPKFHGHLGDTLIALGMLSAVELMHYISEQILMRLKSVFTWDEGVYEFFEDVAVREGVLEVKIELAQFLKEYLLQQAQKIDGVALLQQMGDIKVSSFHGNTNFLNLLNLEHQMDSIIRSVPSGILLRDVFEATTELANDVISADYLGKVAYIALETGMWISDTAETRWRDYLYK